MSVEPRRPRSRRTVLVGAIGAVVAAAAAAVGRPAVTKATNGDAVLLGVAPGPPLDGSGPNEASGTTAVVTTAGNGLVGQTEGVGGGVVGFATATSGATYGVLGQAYSASGVGAYGWSGADAGGVGVRGKATSSSGTGVEGSSTSSTGFTTGVYGEALSSDGTSVWGVASGWAVWGESTSTEKPATTGWSQGDQTGVLGWSGPAPASYPTGTPAKTGVYGYAAQDANARGVWGRSNGGRGVFGQATSGQGVRGYSATGSALYGATSGLKKGFALRAIGRVKLDQCAGIATILSGASSIVVTPGIDLVSTSAVTATLQGNPAGSVTVKSVAVNATNDTFTIYLTAAAAANVKVAWHVFG